MMFDKPESKALDDSLMNQSFLKFVYAQRLWNYHEYFADFSPKTAEVKVLWLSAAQEIIQLVSIIQRSCVFQTWK